MTNYYSTELYHYGVKGQKWGIRRYQNPDGTLTKAGKEHYSNSDVKNSFENYRNKQLKKVNRKYDRALKKVERDLVNPEGTSRLAEMMRNGHAQKLGRRAIEKYGLEQMTVAELHKEQWTVKKAKAAALVQTLAQNAVLAAMGAPIRMYTISDSNAVRETQRRRKYANDHQKELKKATDSARTAKNYQKAAFQNLNQIAYENEIKRIKGK